MQTRKQRWKLPQRTLRMSSLPSPIHHVVLDVDGVITGSLDNVNTPFPHPAIASALHRVEGGRVGVSFCTGKPLFALHELIESVGIGGIHIADGGAQIFDVDKGEPVTSTPLDRTLARKLVKTFRQAGIYLEFYDSQDYYILSTDRSTLTDSHARTLNRFPKTIADPGAFLQQDKLIKLVPVAHSEKEKQKIGQLLTPFAEQLHLYWGIHPNLPAVHFAVLTSPRASKRAAVEQLFAKAKINPKTTLGIGDSSGDWPFIDLCGHQAALGNSDAELLEHIANSTKPHFVGDNVDQNGLLGVLSHFGVLR